ncbi:MAG TPA: putative glycolipid-binding domain-containing protein [Kiloniellales bacterium]|nr:putative glycolipid-binding domain-containing protein [Kiloniellales bacterium]
MTGGRREQPLACARQGGASRIDVVYWRRTDVIGLERLVLEASAEAVVANSTVICVEDAGLQIDYRWHLTPAWQTLSLEVEKQGPKDRSGLLLQRWGTGWKVNGDPRPDLDAAEEPDLSITPFCNSLPIRRLMRERLSTLTLDTCYVDAASMTVSRSKQHYVQLTLTLLRYIDLGAAAGFEADLEIDESGLLTRYQGLFERIAPE